MIKTSGVFGMEVKKILLEVGHRMMEESGETRFKGGGGGECYGGVMKSYIHRNDFDIID